MIYGYCVLHYGKEFLEAALRSVEPIVDKYVISYTPKPSFSFGTDIPCPDSEEEMRSIAERVLGNKLIWISGTYAHEGHHRDVIYGHAKMNDIIIVSDSDEIWKDPEAAIKEAEKTKAHSLRINGFVNFWKSFDYIVHDGFQPVRILQPKYYRHVAETINATIYHLGYMIKPETMRYKLAIHGHRNDIDQVHGSPDKYFEKWNNWTHPGCGIERLHPASRDIWIDAEKYEGEIPIKVEV